MPHCTKGCRGDALMENEKRVFFHNRWAVSDINISSDYAGGTSNVQTNTTAPCDTSPPRLDLWMNGERFQDLQGLRIL